MSSAALQAACAEFDLEQARVAAAQLVNWLAKPGNALPDAEARGVLGQIIENRWFDVAETVAAPLAAAPGASPALQRRYAQILMERGRYEDALARLDELRKRKDLRSTEVAEVIGHVGRARKDQFMASLAAGKPNDTRLKQAIDIYLKGYGKDPEHNLWHGINAVALLALAARTGSKQAALGDAKALANELLQTVQVLRETQQATPYDLATAAEACLALGDYWKAIEWLKQYLPGAGVFALGSTLRQFEQVWRLADASSPAPELLDLLRAEQARRTDGIVKLQRADIAHGLADGVKLEAVFGADRFDSLENYRRGLERCACVARIGRGADKGVGSGFVLPGKVLCERLSEACVLVTNAHVVAESDALRAQGALHPSEAVVTFAALDGVAPDQEFALCKVLFHSPPEALDVTVAELAAPVVPKAPYPLAPVLPVAGSEAQVRVIGHPSGGGLSLSVNRLLDHDPPRLHYRTATEGGSSGSPVFNQNWQLIGLHHAGGDAMPRLKGQPGTYQANEGIWIQAIRAAMNADATHG